VRKALPFNRKPSFPFSRKALLFNLEEVEQWIRRRLRCYLWKQGDRREYRELQRWGVSMDRPMNRFIVVTGLPASGKSTVGVTVARALGLSLFDKDEILEALFEALGV
jgi:hypothetical protein